MTKWILTAFAMLLFMPLSAAAAVHCDHGQNRNIPHGAATARHAAHAESVESVPAAGAVEGCPEHTGQPSKIKVGMMPDCKMKEGCCIKADGPLSTGLSDRLPTNDDQALNILTKQPAADVQMANPPPYLLSLPQDRTEPEPRPPLT